MTGFGLMIGEFEVEDLLAEGAFSYVYQAINPSGQRAALKVAFAGSHPPVNDTGVFLSKALERITNGFSEIQPNAAELLKIQNDRLSGINSPHMVRAQKFVQTANVCYLQMDLIDGSNLRTLMQQNKADISSVVRVIEALIAVSEAGQLEFHGDLKPENIMVSPTAGIVLIDPGFYGTLPRSDSREVHCAVTTPAYYPFINADDLFALGLILWEVATGQVLLARRPADHDRAIGPALKSKIESLESTGNFFYSPIKNVVAPRELKPAISLALEQVLLKAVRLKLEPDGSFEFTAGYASHSELAAALNGV